MNTESYIQQTGTSDPGRYRHLFDGLPADLGEISKITQGLVYHYFADEYHFGWKPPQARLPEINTRAMESILEALLAKDDRPLTKARDYADRLIGCCRDFSLLACAILRHQGRAARLRYGFANYFVEGYWIDHVIVEVWEQERWRRFDPQWATRKRDSLDMLDLPDVAFFTGGKAWQMCRSGLAEPDHFGLGPDVPQVSGWWFIRERLQLDIAALNNIELLCWDGYGDLSEKEEVDSAIIDDMATLSLDPDSRALRQRCQTDGRWRMPTTVTCFHPAVGTSQVSLG